MRNMGATMALPDSRKGSRVRMNASSSTPEPLLPRVAEGDPDAVNACLERYSALVWSLARGLTQDPAMVEDTVQEIIIDLWRSAHRFDSSKASEATFIATIARRRVIDRRRRISRSPISEGLEGRDFATTDKGFEAVDIGDEAARAAAAVGTLKPDQRRVIRMSIVDGLTHREIAETTGLPLGTVKSHVRRGLEKVAEKLRQANEEAPS